MRVLFDIFSRYKFWNVRNVMFLIFINILLAFVQF